MHHRVLNQRRRDGHRRRAVAGHAAAIDRVAMTRPTLRLLYRAVPHRRRRETRAARTAHQHAQARQQTLRLAWSATRLPTVACALPESALDDWLVCRQIDELAEVNLTEIQAVGEHRLCSAVRANDAVRAEKITARGQRRTTRPHGEHLDNDGPQFFDDH